MKNVAVNVVLVLAAGAKDKRVSGGEDFGVDADRLLCHLGMSNQSVRARAADPSDRSKWSDLLHDDAALRLVSLDAFERTRLVREIFRFAREAAVVEVVAVGSGEERGIRCRTAVASFLSGRECCQRVERVAGDVDGDGGSCGVDLNRPLVDEFFCFVVWELSEVSSPDRFHKKEEQDERSWRNRGSFFQ